VASKGRNTAEDVEPEDVEPVAPEAADPAPITPADLVAPKGATLEGLEDTDEIEIIHPDTGQTYGVSVKAFQDLYEPQGFEPIRQGTGQLLPGDPRAPKES